VKSNPRPEDDILASSPGENRSRLESIGIMTWDMDLKKRFGPGWKNEVGGIYVTTSSILLQISDKTAETRRRTLSAESSADRTEETAAFGDADNDAGMLSYVGAGVAVGKTPPKAAGAMPIIFTARHDEERRGPMDQRQVNAGALTASPDTPRPRRTQFRFSKTIRSWSSPHFFRLLDHGGVGGASIETRSTPFLGFERVEPPLRDGDRRVLVMAPLGEIHRHRKGPTSSKKFTSTTSSHRVFRLKNAPSRFFFDLPKRVLPRFQKRQDQGFHERVFFSEGTAAVFRHQVPLDHQVVEASVVPLTGAPILLRALTAFLSPRLSASVADEPIGHRLILVAAHILAHADIGLPTVRISVRQKRPQERAPGVSDDEDLFPAEPLSQQVDKLGRIVRHPGDGHRSGIQALVVAHPEPALVPADQGRVHRQGPIGISAPVALAERRVPACRMSTTGNAGSAERIRML
jgi:hypothetical protein